MSGKNKGNLLLMFFLFFLPIAGGVAGVFIVVSNLAVEGTKPPYEPATHFYVKNETEIITEKPVVYNVTLENREGEKVEYGLKVRLDGKEIHNEQIILQNNETLNEAISVIPNLKGNPQKLEFVLNKGIKQFRNYVFQIIPSIDYSHAAAINPKLLKKSETVENNLQITNATKEDIIQENDYTVEKNEDTIIYKFDTGERLEMKVKDGVVSEGDAVYSTVSDENRIVFIQEPYEKIFPTSITYLYPVILDIKDKELPINDTLNIKNGYSVTLREIDSQKINGEVLKIEISKDNRIVREIISQRNSPIEFWNLIDDFKKDKILRIIPSSISETEILIDITQFGNKKRFSVGDKFEEFEIVNITEDSIIMKNIQPLSILTGTDLTLIKGKIKIKV